MKVTAIIPDDLIKAVQAKAGRTTLTECLVVALKDWVSQREIQRLNQLVASGSFEFEDASKIRKSSRRRA